MAERDFVAECIRLHAQDKKQLIIRGFSRRIIQREERLKYM